MVDTVKIPDLPAIAREPDGSEQLECVQDGTSSKITGEELNRTPDGAPNHQTGTSYTLAADDIWVLCDNAAPFTLTVPDNTSVPINIGRGFNIVWYGVGAVTVAAAGGVTIRAPDTLGLAKRYATVTLLKIAANEWIAAGYFAP